MKEEDLKQLRSIIKTINLVEQELIQVKMKVNELRLKLLEQRR